MIDFDNRNEIADAIIENRLSYREASEKSKFTIKHLRSIVHAKRKQRGTIYDKPWRPKLLDAVGEEELITIKDQNVRIDPNTAKDSLKSIIKIKIFETFKRRHPNYFVDSIEYNEPSKKTLHRYFRKIFLN
jgi:hypothetical protein